MSYIGEYVELQIDRFTSVGAFLTDNQDFEVLLPNKYLTDVMELEDRVTVFIYNDSEDRPVATTETPKIELGGFAFLTVKAVTQFGAFLDWGLEKDLLVPFSEQLAKMQEGGVYLIALQKDQKTNRLIGSAKINKYLSTQVQDLNQGDKVELFIAEETELGRKVIVNNQYAGLIFRNHLVRPFADGEIAEGYIEFIRQDGKIDISLVPIGIEKFDEFAEKVLAYIHENDGKITLTDKSDPDLIRETLGMSKKSFKKALGQLYRERKIVIFPGVVQLASITNTKKKK